MEDLLVIIVILLAGYSIIRRIRLSFKNGTCSGCSSGCSECASCGSSNQHYIDLSKSSQGGEDHRE